MDNVQMPNFVNVISQNTEIDSGDWSQGDDDLVLTTYVTVTDGTAEAGVGLSPQTITVTTTSHDEVTITPTEAPITLATSMAPITQVRIVTATVTATPPGRVCTSIGTAIAVPTTLVVALGMVSGVYLWLLLKKRRDSRRRPTAAVNRFSLMDGSNEDSSTPVPYSPPRGSRAGGGETDGPREGIMAPPSSLASRRGGPFADPKLPLDYQDSPISGAHGIQVRGDASAFQSQRSSVVSSLSSAVPQSGSSMDLFQGAQPNTGIATRSNSLATVLSDTANGQLYRPGRVFIPMNDGEFVGFDNGNYDSGRTRFPTQLRTVVYAPPANATDDIGPVIRSAQTAPLRPIEIVGGSHSSRRASMVDEQDFTNPRSSICTPITQGPARLVKLEGSPVPRRSPSGAKGNSEGSVSKNNDKEDPKTLSKDTPFELSADNPVLKMDTDGAFSAPSKLTEAEDGDESVDGVHKNKAKDVSKFD